MKIRHNTVGGGLMLKLTAIYGSYCHQEKAYLSNCVPLGSGVPRQGWAIGFVCCAAI